MQNLVEQKRLRNQDNFSFCKAEKKRENSLLRKSLISLDDQENEGLQIMNQKIQRQKEKLLQKVSRLLLKKLLFKMKNLENGQKVMISQCLKLSNFSSTFRTIDSFILSVTNEKLE